MLRHSLELIEEVCRRGDFILATFFVLFSFLVWSLGQMIPWIRALRWGVSAVDSE